MVITWQIILTIIIVSLSIIMPICYSYQKKKNLKYNNEPSKITKIKDYVIKVNDENKNKIK
jgi:hypothetical protein